MSMEEFKQFRDYFGLYKLVKSIITKEEPANNTESTFKYRNDLCERRDSLSRVGSEFSSSNSAKSYQVMHLYYPHEQFPVMLIRQGFMDSRRSFSGNAAPRPPSLLLARNVSTKLQPLKSIQLCVFCRNNGESEKFYTSHNLKDAYGKAICPVLRAYTCPLCGTSGDDAHTVKYCPQYAHGRRPGTVTVSRKK